MAHSHSLPIRALLWVLLLFLGGYSQTTYIIHLLDPWNSEANGREIRVRGYGSAGFYPGAAMTAEENNWYRAEITLPEPPEGPENFSFTSYVTNNDGPGLGPNGIADPLPAGEGFSFLTTFASCSENEIWVISNEENPPNLYCTNPLTKSLILFSPWMSGNINVSQNGTKAPAFKSLTCGWESFNFADTINSLEITLSNNLTGEIYGEGGLGNSNPIDLSSYFAMSDSVYLYPSPFPTLEGQAAGPPQISTEFPGFLGTCQYILGITVRDFSKDHPNFEFQTLNQYPISGMVMPTLGPNAKPQKNPAANPSGDGVANSEFESWFNTASNTGVDSLNNYQTCRTLSFAKTWDGFWEYSSLNEPSHGFFPIDDFTTLPDKSPNRNRSQYTSNYQPMQNGEFQVQFLNDPTGAEHNFHFCSELHAEFTHAPGHSLLVGGDDDVWAFVNDSLVVDFGGAHLAAQKEVLLDTLGLTEGERYPLDIFQCERHTTSSNFIIRTTLLLEPPTDLNIDVSPEAVDQGLPNCNIPDSTLIPVSQSAHPEPRPNITQKQFQQYLQKRGYPRYYSPDKDGYYSPKGVFSPNLKNPRESANK